MTMGALYCPPVMYRQLPTWVAIWSMATYVKSLNMISAHGRIPVSAAPRAVPTIPDSQIGVFRTRSFPNRSTRPAVNPKTARVTSIPMTKTRSSRAISSANASPIACT